jgi:uncharacterized membrane protein (UPF0136 family)
MDKLSASLVAALVLAALYGLTSLIGGIIGYVSKGSVPSIVAGSISGVLLLLCAAAMSWYPIASLVGALIVSLALTGRFAPKAFGLTEKTAGTVDYVMTAGGIAVIVAAVIALIVLLRPSAHA